ncbi:Protein farnesyltransferase, alpha subunit/protein geranylgeranyltransferase type I, alpha subunit [Phaffia rhodozyma]|uniref:Protein farnesyltransferase/geranylgeranyltransferase type-1 subunit alpha n=1 Tax=Phaffia rhodozyma TaxID=264483 RepID=A0A0F7SJU8_PHARH|nr:Protein farnesyltransferase, alpha subunit/protein geranylgeranyltransferase type I, alpha subunit [Phaffia rhodozyma]
MASSMFSQDPRWADLNPIPQIEPENSLVPIMYSLEYQDAMGYFRALSALEEYSDRALEVTLRVIRMNPAHYTVWQYRFSTLMKLQRSLEDELRLMTELAEDNMKSYQVWHHRLLLLTHLPSPISPSTIHRELDFIATSLEPDAKNYHTWAYRQYVLTHFGPILTEEDWTNELAWCESLLVVQSGRESEESEVIMENHGSDEEEDDEWIEENKRGAGDVRNNSAWTHRWFLVFGREGAKGKDGLAREIDYTTDQIRKVPNNTSSWAYLRGVHSKFGLSFTSESGLAQSVIEACALKGYPCPLATEWLVDVAVENEEWEEAGQLLDRLSLEDPVRSRYWAYRKSRLGSHPISTDSSIPTPSLTTT